MLTLHVRQGLLGEDGITTHKLPCVEGLTARKLAEQFQALLPRSCPVDVAVNGHLLEGDYEQPLADGDEVVLCPHTTYGVDIIGYIVYALISAVVGVGVSYAVAALTPKPKAPDNSFERGDSSSATYAWDGIRTNYGQGWTVPVVYGRHAVGGQVIESNVEASGNSAFTNDRVQLLLALSEGPIHAIGDVEVSENDYLGSLSNLYTPATPVSLPSDIYVNDTLLVNDAQSEVTEYGPVHSQFGGVSYNWNPQTPDVNVGDTVFFWNATTNTRIIPPGDVEVLVTQVNGNSTNPFTVISEPVPAGVGTAIAAGNVVELQVGGFGAGFTPARRLYSGSSTVIPQIDASAGALAFLRSGELDQSPMPYNVNQSFGWNGTFTAVGVGLSLDNFGQTAEISYDPDGLELNSVRVTLQFPAGLFTVNTQGQTEAMFLKFEVAFREVGASTFTFLGDFTVGALERGTFTRTKDFALPTLTTAPIEVQVKRMTGSGGTGTASAVKWRDAVFMTPAEFAYPRIAQLGLILQANARFSGGMPKVQARVDGIKVRVWDATNGFSERCWDVPDAPFNWHTHPPGRNPAWILLDFLLQPWGLGEYLTEDDLDLPAFARWAVWCDRDPNPSDPWGEAQFACDLVIDKPRPTWEWVMTICAAGGASPVFVNGKLSIVYQYAAAHAQGSVSVPAKTSTQLFTTGNMQDLAVEWLPRSNRPTAFVYQFINEDTNYRQDVATFEDGESTLNDPTELHKDQWRPEQQQAYGVTRASQLFRDAKRRHRINRLVTRKVDFKTGRWALAATIGDLIDVEAEVMRPFANDVPTSAAVLVGGTGVSTVTVDHTSLPSTGQMKYRDANGAPQVVNWTGTASTTVDLTDATELTLASSITVDAGAPCVVGTVDKLVETYEIVKITLNEDLSRVVTALQWVPAVHDDIAPDDYTDGTDLGNTGTASSAVAPVQLPPDYTVQVEHVGNGQQRISWSSPALLAGVPKRVYLLRDDAQWQLLGVTEHDHLDTDELRPNEQAEVVVVPETFDGEARIPDALPTATVTPPEFNRNFTPAVQGVEVGHRSQLRWSPVTTPVAEEYEVREGRYWVGARRLYRGTNPAVDWDVPPLADHVHVCVEDEDGSQGQPTQATLTPWNPDNYTTFVNERVVQSGSGEFVNVQRSGTDYIEFQAGALSGTYTSATMQPGFKATFLWRVSIEAQQVDTATVDDVLDRLGSGELDWRTVDAREASRYTPGVDFTRNVDDATEHVDAYQDEAAGGFIGAAGQHTRAQVEGRFYDGSAWSAWEPWTDQYRNAEMAEFRVVMDRESTDYELRLHKLRITAHL